jgi:hypothetical protein
VADLQGELDRLLAVDDSLSAIGGLTAGDVRPDLTNALQALNAADLSASSSDVGNEVAIVRAELQGELSALGDDFMPEDPSVWARQRNAIQRGYTVVIQAEGDLEREAAVVRARADALNSTLSKAGSAAGAVLKPVAFGLGLGTILVIALVAFVYLQRRTA